MSDNNSPQTSEFRPNGMAAPAGLPSPAKPAKPAGKGLPTFLKVSIILLIGLTVASISLLFIGDFEGRFERVFSTFALFAVFVVLTAIDTSRERKNDWYAPVALIANTYILGLLLIVIWMTPFSAYSLMFDIMWKSIFVIVVIRLVIICCELLLRSGQKAGDLATRFAFITSILAMLSGILFTAPTGVAAFDLEIPDLYWKISTALLILTALGLSVTLLLRWSSKSDDREAQRNAVAAAEAAALQAGFAQPAPYLAAPQYPGAPQYPAAQQYPGAQQFPAAQAFPPAQQFPAAQPFPAAQQPAEAPVEELLPWPTFADGQPYPATADGQPDFEAAAAAVAESAEEPKQEQ